MPNPQQQPSYWGATQFLVGFSTIVKVGLDPYQCQSQLRWLSGGSLEIVPLIAGVAGGTLTGSSVVLQGKGYLLGITEVFQNQSSAILYLMATGGSSGAVVNMVCGYTQPTVTGISLP